MKIITDGKLRVYAALEKGEALPTADFNGDCLAFERLPSPEAPVLGRNLIWNAGFQAGAKGWDCPKGHRVGLDLDDRWVLSGGRTLYVRASEEKPAGIAFYVGEHKTGRLAVRAGQRYQFSALLGFVRCSAFIQFEFYDRHGNKVGEDRREFARTAKRGGTSRPDYEPVTVTFDIPPGVATVRPGIGILRTELWPGETPGASDLVLFMSEPSLVLDREDFHAQGFESGDKTVIALHEALSHGLEIAALPANALSSRDGGALHVADQTIDLAATKPLPALDLSLHPVPDNALRVPLAKNSALLHEGALRLDVDGKPACLVSWRTDQIADEGIQLYFRIPAVFMDGRPHGLELFSAGGERLYAEARVLAQTQTLWSDILKHTMPPHDGKLAPIAGLRHSALTAQLSRIAAAPDPAAFAAQLDHCHKILVRGFPYITDFKPLTFPETPAPQVSVVIPAHNKFNVTYACLCSLLFAPVDASFEVIVVDDGSSDQTRSLAQIVQGIRVIRHKKSKGFQGAAEAGAKEARGDFILFLNNDTEVTTGWLDELLYPFSRWTNVGATGAKLIYGDGRLQDAGGVVQSGGKPYNYGRLKPMAWPQANYTRQVDYLTGACLMVRKTVWREVKGFSPEFAPAYYEDTDLAFKIREKGYKTIFAPKAVVIHYEGISHGRDTADASSYKRFQAINAPKFEKKWAHQFGAQPVEGEELDLIKDRGIKGRVLFIDNEVPRPDYDAGSYAAIQEMRMFQALGYKVSFLPGNLAYLGKYTEDLQRDGVEVLFAPFAVRVREFLAARGHEYDYVFITRYYVANKFISQVRRYAPQAKILFNNADCHFLREMRAALIKEDAEDREKALKEARRVQRDELAVMRAVDLNFSYNDTEIDVLNTHLMGAVPVTKLAWVQEAVADIAPHKGREGIMFLGGFGHTPNLEALEYLAEKVMPRVAASHPDIVLYVYGSRTTDEVRAYEAPNVRIMGQIPDLKDAFDRHRLFVAPLLSGAGIKGKLLTAMAHGVPALVSAIAAEGVVGLPPESIADTDPATFANAILSALNSDKTHDVRNSLADHYGLEVGASRLKEALDSLEIADQSD